MDLSPGVSRIAFLKHNRFETIGNVGDLIKNGFPESVALQHPGIYAISLPEGYQFRTIPLTEAIAASNVVKPWPIEKLKEKWVPKSDVIYYGLAGANSPRSLKSRLQNLVDHANGKTTDRGPHCGGEIIWQLAGWEQFSIWILPTGNPPEPRNLEAEILKKFYTEKGQLPFGNRKF